MRKILLAIIKIYQMSVSPFLGRNCRFLPSCSDYCAMSVEKHGAVKGVWFSLRRILHCNCFSKGGLDLP